MPRKHDDPTRDPALLLDMLAAASAVRSFVAGKTWENYSGDLLLRSGVERQIEIIGEAARGVSDQTRRANPRIPWRAIMAQRHRLSHEYGAVDDALIWSLATIHVPVLISELARLVPPDTA